MADNLKTPKSAHSAPLQIPYYDWPYCQYATMSGSSQDVVIQGDGSHVEVENVSTNSVIYIRGDGTAPVAATNGSIPVYPGTRKWINIDLATRTIKVIGTAANVVSFAALKGK